MDKGAVCIPAPHHCLRLYKISAYPQPITPPIYPQPIRLCENQTRVLSKSKEHRWTLHNGQGRFNR